MRRVRPARWPAVLGAVVMLLVACGPAPAAPNVPAATATAVVGGTMQLRLYDTVGSLDVQAVVNTPAYQVSLALFDRLVALDSKGDLLPYLAESWTTSPTSVTFKLRSGVTCADGAALTPTAIANSFKRFTTVNSPMARQAYGPGPWTFTANDADRTLTMALGTPYGDAVYGFVAPTQGVFCPAALAADPKELADKVYGSGPFTLETLGRDDKIVLKARPDWKWGPFGVTAQTPGFPQQVVFKVVQNETTAANLLLTGGLDIARVDGQDVPRLKATEGLVQDSGRTFYRYALVMNETQGHPTADEAVRQALMTATDPKGWVQTAYAGFGQIGTSLFPADWECYEPATAQLVPQPSTDKAKAVLQAAGYTLGSNGKFQKDGKALSVRLVAAMFQGSGPEYLAEQFDKAGIATVLQVVDANTNSLSIRSGNYDVAIQRPGGTAPTPARSIALFSGPLPPQGTNFSFILDPQIDQDVAKAVATTGPERCQFWKNVQRRYLEKHHLLPLASPEYTAFGRGIDFRADDYNIEPASLKRRP